MSLKFWVYNCHSVPLTITGLEKANLQVRGTHFPGGKSARLPSPRIDGEWLLPSGQGSTFQLDVEVRGVELYSMPLKDLILSARDKGVMLAWSLRGDWKMNIYDEAGQTLNSGALDHSAVPFSARND